MTCALVLSRFRCCAVRLARPATIAGLLYAALPQFATAQNTGPDATVVTPPRTVAQAAPEAPRTLRVVLLLPLDSAMLKRAAITVRDGANAVFASRKTEVTVSECSYGADSANSVAIAYARCVDANVDWVIGPLGRSDVTALALAKLPTLRPTLMLSPLGTAPPVPLAVLAPDLESEAEAIAQQATEDACRKPLLAEAGGSLASRVAVAISGYWRERVASPLQQASIGPRDTWRRAAEGWRRDNIDCVLFAGGGSVLSELRPYLRGMVIYATSASYEAPLDRTLDWTGVRIADAPWLVDGDRAEFTPLAPSEPLSPTLARLYALGVDAARLVLSAGRNDLPTSFAGAIGQLTLRDAQYRRQPMIGEFRERALVKVGP